MFPTKLNRFKIKNFKSHHPVNTKTLSQREKVGSIDVVSSLEIKVSPTSVDAVMSALKSDVVVTECQPCDNSTKS